MPDYEAGIIESLAHLNVTLDMIPPAAFDVHSLVKLKKAILLRNLPVNHLTMIENNDRESQNQLTDADRINYAVGPS